MQKKSPLWEVRSRETGSSAELFGVYDDYQVSLPWQ